MMVDASIVVIESCFRRQKSTPDLKQAALEGTKEVTASIIASTITTIVNRYYQQDTWKTDLIFSEDSFELLQDILESAGELSERAPYEELVDTSYAEKAVAKS